MPSLIKGWLLQKIQAKYLTMKRIFYIITIALCFMAVPSAHAVTDKEMDQARAIAAHAYLRYANDGSGYLDAVHPKSMAELEKVLKNKEKENLKAFKNIPVPTDYASWDKKQLVEYWSDKAFATKGLLDKGKIGKSRAKKNLNAMTVSAPAAKETPKETPAASTPEKTQASPSSQTTPSKSAPTAAAAVPETTTDSINKEAEAILDAENQLFADLEDEPQMSKAKDHTWIYVVILCLLVGVVVALVVFASNVMKKNAARATANQLIPQKNDAVFSGDTNAMREKFAATLAAKNEEISSLSQKIESLNSQNKSLKTSLEKLTAEVASLRTRLSGASHKLAQYQEEAKQVSQSQPAPAPRQHEPVANRPEPKAVASPAQEDQAPKVRSIYLGRVNNKGLFTRADRTLKPGLSIYRLDTTDGYVGTFRVAQDPDAWETALRAPIEMLGGGCIAPDMTSTAGKTKIINDSAGTTIYDGEAWKVTRKAKVHFE